MSEGTYRATMRVDGEVIAHLEKPTLAELGRERAHALYALGEKYAGRDVHTAFDFHDLSGSRT
jgi:hypothetical protein